MADPPVERRLTSRILRVWKAAAGASFPRRSHIDPAQIGTDWANCLMIDLDEVPARSRFSYVGNALRDSIWPTFDRQCISECLEGTLLELVARHIPKVLEQRKPISFAGSAFHQETDILYRTVLLPLSENGRDIDGLLAAIGFREIAAEEGMPTMRQDAAAPAMGSRA